MLNIKVIMQLLTLVTPYFIVFFFVLLSILNSNIKGFVYLFGLIIVYSIISVFKETLPSNPQSNEICSIFGNYHGNSPSFITAFRLAVFSFFNPVNAPAVICQTAPAGIFPSASGPFPFATASAIPATT